MIPPSFLVSLFSALSTVPLPFRRNDEVPQIPQIPLHHYPQYTERSSNYLDYGAVANGIDESAAKYYQDQTAQQQYNPENYYTE